MQIVGIKKRVFDLMKIFNIFKKKDEISDFWYEAGSRFDVRSRYFYVPNTDLKINITASGALRIIHEYKIKSIYGIFFCIHFEFFQIVFYRINAFPFLLFHQLLMHIEHYD